MKVKLYYNTEHDPLNDPANQGFGETLILLDRLRSQGISYDKVDTAELPSETIYEAYAEAWYPSVSKKFGIRRVFGTRRRSGCFFGREVPALLVYEDDDPQPTDVYPQERLGRIITIKEYLIDILVDSTADA